MGKYLYIILFLLSFNAQAQNNKIINLNIGIIQPFIKNNNNDLRKMGFAFNSGYLNSINNNFDIELFLGYNYTQFKSISSSIYDEWRQKTNQNCELGLNFKYYPIFRKSFYVFIGTGLVRSQFPGLLGVIPGSPAPKPVIRYGFLFNFGVGKTFALNEKISINFSTIFRDNVVKINQQNYDDKSGSNHLMELRFQTGLMYKI